jgi:pimeloyl-ACP methyl ester carboxylesterase
MAERISVAVGELVFDALTAGPADGQLVLLLHGFPQRSLAWAEVLEALAGGGYRVVAPDQRGYSPRARPASVGDYRMECLVSDVLGLADALGTRRFAVVGHDWGGAVAWQLAARHPERAWALTSVSTPHPAALLAAMTRGLQRLRSAYVPLFRAPRVAEALLGGGGGRGLRALLAASGLANAVRLGAPRHSARASRGRGHGRLRRRAVPLCGPRGGGPLDPRDAPRRASRAPPVAPRRQPVGRQPVGRRATRRARGRCARRSRGSSC